MPDTACTGDNNCTTSDSRTLSVCSSRDEKILPGQSLDNVSQTNYAAQLDPGEWPACTSKNKKGFLEINDMSLDYSSSCKKESFAPLIQNSGATTHTGVTLIEGTIDDCTVTSVCEAFPVNLSEERDSCLNKETSLLVLKKFSSVDEDHGTQRYCSNTTIEIDVSMSPTSHRARQACLTPSEWQSVNDMPRVNRVPFTNQTQRITPLKEKARRNKSPGHNLSKMLLIDGSRIDENQNSGSSNSSTSSATFSDSKYGSKDRRFQIGESDNKLGPNDVSEAQAESPHLNSVPVSGEAIDSDLEETATCNYSDISSHDEKQIYDVIDSEAQSHEAVNTYENDIVDNTFQDIAAIVAQSGCHVSGRHRNRDSGSNSNNNRKSDGDSDSDSDNDLGQFYTPSPLLKSVDKMIASNPVVSSSSFGYISSYPSIGSSP